jgi:tRNA A-37 threonylcarbamoyl transferase component Bud32
MNSRQPADSPLTAAEVARLARNPGPFTLILDARGNEDTLLKCRQVVRMIPGKRLVCQGEWQGDDVFIKLYIGAEKLFRKELEGLKALRAGGIAAPAVRYSGSAGEGTIYIILLEPVQPAATLEAAWEAAADEPARIELLRKSVATIAQHHRAGLEQLDIHLDNFLLSDGRLFTLDGGGIHVCPAGELSVKSSRNNLALFFAQFYPEHDYLIDAVLPLYEQRRQYRAGSIPAGHLHERVDYFRRRRQRRFLKKIFRDCSAFLCHRSLRRYMVCDRAMASPSMLEFLADPDASLALADSEYLKQGNTCTLWRARVGQHTLVIKRYNIKGIKHHVSRLFRTTRAAVSWQNAHRLETCGILTPKPVALVEQRFGPLRGRAWYVTEYVQGDDALVLCNPPAAGLTDTQAAATSVVALLKRMAHCRISHGDMKGNNFILSKQGATVIDLDAMKQHDHESGFRRSQQRDMRRFMRNWTTCPETAAMFQKLLRDTNLIAGK